MMRVLNRLVSYKNKIFGMADEKYLQIMTAKSSGIDGLLVTVGLCVIALVLCVVMKDSLNTFITTIVSSMQEKATTILNSGMTS